MTNRSIQTVFAFLLPFLASFAGCTTQTPEQQVAATDKVLQEVEAATPVEPTVEPTVETAVAPEGKDALPTTVVKQSTDGLHGSPDSEANPIANPQGSPAPVDRSGVQKSAPKPFLTIDNPSAKWIALEDLPRETWEVQYLGNVPVGFLHRKTVVAESYFRHDADSRMRVSLKGIPLEQRIRVTTIERDNGELVSIEGSLEIGLNKKSFKGNVRQDKMELSGFENGQPFSLTIDWSKDYRGPFAVDQSMHRNPLKPKESRKLKYLDPILRKIIEGRLEAGEYIMTPTLLGGSKNLLEIRNIAMTIEGDSQSLLWVDSSGESFKSYVQDNDILSFRTDPIGAQTVRSNLDLRAIEPILIPLAGSVERLTEPSKGLTSMEYLVRHRSKDPFGMFADRIGQRIHSVDPRTVTVTFFQNGGSLPEEEASKVDKGTLAASEFVPSESTLVTKLSKALIAADKTISPDNPSNTAKANACRKEIQKRIRLKEFDKQIGTIANSLKTKQANCIEHALLFASVCRSLNIPTRIAMGVKFSQSTENPTMKFHAWIEIRDGERWVPMDSSEDMDPISIDRVKIRDSNFNNPNPYLDLLDVYRQLPELSVQVLPR